MQLHKFKIHWGAICLITVLSLVMYGCGGGGSSSSSAMDMEEEMMSGDDDGDTAADDESTEEDTAKTAAEEEARIMGLTAAIADPDGDGTPGGDLQKSDRPAATANITLATGGVISYGADKLGVDDKDDDGESVKGQFSAPTAATAISGWTGTTQSITNDNVMTELVIYSDAEDPKNEKYMTYFGEDNATGDNPRPTVVSLINTTDEGGTPDEIKDGTLTLAGSTSTALGDEAALFGGSVFEFTGSTLTVPGADDTATDEEDNERAGTFAGVPGTFICGAGAGASCTLSKNAKGVLTSIGASWTFRPDGTASNINVQDVIMDADYLAYSYWLVTTTKTDGSKTYRVNVFATGSKPFAADAAAAATAIGPLVKSATYNGNATGLYTEKDFSTGAGIPSAAGQFTADARLTASFGGDAIPVDDQFTIKGTVNNFKDSDGETISGGAWSVNLSKSDFSGRAEGAVTGDPGTAFANSFGGSTNGGGSWTGAFYGPTTVDDTDTDDVDESVTGYPSGVAGEFNAHFGNGHVVGAFGATKQ